MALPPLEQELEHFGPQLPAKDGHSLQELDSRFMHGGIP